MRYAICIALVVIGINVATAKSGSTPPAANNAEYGEQAYKTNCTRCHVTPPALSPREARVVMRHMRVKANLPARDAEAVLVYLLQSEGGR